MLHLLFDYNYIHTVINEHFPFHILLAVKNVVKRQIKLSRKCLFVVVVFCCCFFFFGGGGGARGR